MSKVKRNRERLVTKRGKVGITKNDSSRTEKTEAIRLRPSNIGIRCAIIAQCDFFLAVTISGTDMQASSVRRLESRAN